MTEKPQKEDKNPKLKKENYINMLKMIGIDLESEKEKNPPKPKEERRKKKRKEIQEIGIENEFNISKTSDNLRISDILSSLGVEEQSKNPKSIQNKHILQESKIKKGIKELSGKNVKMAINIGEASKKRMERTTNYSLANEEMNKWIPQIKQNREATYMEFKEEFIPQNLSATSIGTSFQPISNMEKQINTSLIKQGLHTEDAIKNNEFDCLKNLTPKEVEERIAHLGKLKKLLFTQELKNKRVAKIKSKLYHKIKKKNREKEEKRILEQLEEIDPEAAAKYREQQELKRVDERIKQRHSTNIKFAKNLFRFGGHNDRTKEGYAELIRQRDLIKQKVKGINKFERGEDASDATSDDMFSDDDMDKNKRKAISMIERELEEEGKSENEEQMDPETVTIDFSKKLSKSKKEKQKTPDVSSMKFMQNTQITNENRLREEAKMLIQEIQGEENKLEIDEEREGEANISMSKNIDFKRDKKKIVKSIHNIVDNIKQTKEKDMEVQKEISSYSQWVNTNSEQSDIQPKNSIEKTNQEVNLPKKRKRKEKKDILRLEKDDEILDQFNVDKYSSNKHSKLGEELLEAIGTEIENQQDFELLRCSIMQNDENLKDFAQLKEKEYEGNLKPKQKCLDGWNSWFGEGIDTKPIDLGMENKLKQEQIENIKKKRKDGCLANVILNESRDKQFNKYMVQELPHPYSTARQFEALMKMPLGPEWNTISAHRRLIQPEIVKRTGEVIQPIKYQKNIPAKTIETLIEMRKKPDRPPVKL